MKDVGFEMRAPNASFFCVERTDLKIQAASKESPAGGTPRLGLSRNEMKRRMFVSLYVSGTWSLHVQQH